MVGATDGSDKVNLDSAGGEFVGTPSFSYATTSSGGSNIMVGALYCASVVGQAAGRTDTAAFYSYPQNTFNSASLADSLTGSTTNVAGSTVTFTTQVMDDFKAVSVFESGAGTDVANLTSPGNGSFFETATLYDAPGTNAIAASGSTATLATSVESVTLNNVGNITAVKKYGTNDTIHLGATDFLLSAPGWTSV